ncbi:hypothetical protein IGI04_040488, partial [Brassica rapa subsp. trilocularis]
SLFALHKSLSGFGVSIGDIRGTWKHLGSKREWKMLFRRAKHQSGVRERRATPAPEESKAGATSCTEVIHPLQAQLLVDDFHYAERPMAATSLTRGGCRATSGATSSTRAHFGEVKHVFRSDLWERPSAPAPRRSLTFSTTTTNKSPTQTTSKEDTSRGKTLTKGTISLGKTPLLVSIIPTISLLKLKEVLHKLQLQIQVWMQ